MLFINFPHFSFDEDNIPSTMQLHILWQLSEQPVTEYANEEKNNYHPQMYAIRPLLRLFVPRLILTLVRNVLQISNFPVWERVL